MCIGFYVCLSRVTSYSLFDPRLHSICLFVMSLFSEVPHDLAYYYKYVVFLQASAPDLRSNTRIGAWTDLAMMFITFTLSVIWNVEIGIVVSLIIALLLVVRRSSKTRMTVLVSPSKSRSLHMLTGNLTQGRVPGTNQWRPVTDIPEAEDIPGAMIVRIRESLDFGTRNNYDKPTFAYINYFSQ